MVMIDAIARLVPGVLNNDASAEFETFHDNLLEYPNILDQKPLWIRVSLYFCLAIMVMLPSGEGNSH